MAFVKTNFLRDWTVLCKLWFTMRLSILLLINDNGEAKENRKMYW